MYRRLVPMPSSEPVDLRTMPTGTQLHLKYILCIHILCADCTDAVVIQSYAASIVCFSVVDSKTHMVQHFL